MKFSAAVLKKKIEALHCKWTKDLVLSAVPWAKRVMPSHWSRQLRCSGLGSANIELCV